MRALRLVSILMIAITPAMAAAHPVAQGKLELRIEAAAVTVRLDVSNEEIFVASTFAPAAGAASSSLEELQRGHAAYVLAHLRVSADGARLAGELRSIVPSEDRTTNGLVAYELRYPLPASNGRPSKLTVEQDLLREISFAPGNPWEATFVTRVVEDGRVVAEGLLLTAAQPIEWLLEGRGNDEGMGSFPHRRVIREYVEHGVRHILGGWDHLLFMAALVFGVSSVFDLIAVVTAFTLAHTLTLTLATLGLAIVPSTIVEPMIAASIVAAAAHNLMALRSSTRWTRLGVAFGFGLFHGLGFAGGLLVAMSGMAGIGVATAIAAFSVGVEIGHQLVAVPLFVGLQLLQRFETSGAPLARRAGSAVVLLAGLYYFGHALP